MTRCAKRTKSIAFEDWPLPLQQEWQRAMTDPNIPDGNGGFLRILTDAQTRNIRQATEMYVKYQTDCGVPLDTSLQERFAYPASIIEFHAIKREDEEENTRSQTGRLKSSSDYVDRLHSARLRILDGERDPLFEEWLRETRDECGTRGEILVAPVDIPTLLRVATAHMDFLTESIRSGVASIEHYRDYQTAHTVGFLVHLPVRVRSLTNMKASLLVLRGGCITMQVPILKNRKWETLRFKMPAAMTPYWEFFLRTVRPVLNSNNLDDLWVHENGEALRANIHANRFVKFIREETGMHMSPHRVRHAAAEHAEALGMDLKEVAILLQERNPNMVERRYKRPAPIILKEAYDTLAQLFIHKNSDI